MTLSERIGAAYQAAASEADPLTRELAGLCLKGSKRLDALEAPLICPKCGHRVLRCYPRPPTDAFVKLSTRFTALEAERDIAIAERDALKAALLVVERARTRFAVTIRWALGEEGEFSPRAEGAGPYWWRNELRQRAVGLTEGG